MRALCRLGLPDWMPARRKRELSPCEQQEARSLAAWSGTARRAAIDETGSSAVEFALVVFPVLMFCLGILQFLFLHYTQQTLSDALYSSASNPESELLSGDKSGYIAKVCAKVAFKTDCLNSTSGLKVEMMRLDDLPTTPTAITGSTFVSGSSGDVLVIRAKMPIPKIVAFIPQLTAKDSVLFRRQ